MAPSAGIKNSSPYLTGLELKFLEESVALGNWAGDGPFSEKCCALLSELTGSPVFLTPSGTHALELGLMSLNLAPGDEVILPSYTFVSTANALVINGLKPVFVDIRSDTLNLDEKLIEQAITKKTKAILPVHYAGVAAEMDAINSIAKKQGLTVIEDAAQGVNAYYKERPLGSLGDLGAFSFHQTKNFTCGEGGALVVSNKELLHRIQIHRQKGTDRTRFLKGEVDKYTWVDRGSSYLMSDLLAAFLYAQLQSMNEITLKRKKLFNYYLDGLRPLSNHYFQLPIIPSTCQSNYHLFYLLLENNQLRNRLQAYLKEHNIEASTHFEPLHDSKGGKKYGVVRGPMTVTNNIAANILRLPLLTDMTQEEQDRVVDALESFFKGSI